MKHNIYVQIYNILSEYENLLDHVRSNNSKKDNSNSDNKMDHMQNNFMNDDFMSYIFNNIKATPKETSNANINVLQLEEQFIDTPDNFSNFPNNPNDPPIHNNEEIIKETSEIEIFMKKYYKKIILLTHPDKTSDKSKNDIFMKAKLNLENKFLIGIIKNCYDLKISIDDLTDIILNQIIDEIRMIQEKIVDLKKTHFID